MKLLISCILNILGIGIIACNFNLSCKDIGDFLAIVVTGILLNAAGTISKD